MNKYILAVILFLQAIILSLCLAGFTLLKGAIIQNSSEVISAKETSDVSSSTDLPLVNEENKESRLRGEVLFKSNCTTCHGISRQQIGPKLQEICDKYPEEADKQWLYNWIRNSPKMIFVDKDPRAIELWESNKKIAMNPFPNFTDQDLQDILEYIQPGCFDN